MNIQIDEKYSISTDKYNWIVTETYEGKDKEGNAKKQTKDHFFPRLSWCVNWLINNDCKEAKSLEEIKKKLDEAKAICMDTLHKVQKAEG